MKQLLQSFLLPTILLVFSFYPSVNAQKPTAIPFKKVEGFALIEGKQPPVGQTGLLFVRDRQFDMYFKKNPTAKQVTKIDFATQTVITLMGAKVQMDNEFSIDKIVRNGNKMEIYFVTVPGKKKKKNHLPFCLYTMAPQKNLMGLAYYLDGKLLENVVN